MKIDCRICHRVTPPFLSFLSWRWRWRQQLQGARQRKILFNKLFNKLFLISIKMSGDSLGLMWLWHRIVRQSEIMLNMLNRSASQSRSTFPSSPSPQNGNHVAGDFPIFPVEARTCGTGTPPRLFPPVVCRTSA